MKYVRLEKFNARQVISSFKSSLNKNNALNISALLIKKAPQVGLGVDKHRPIGIDAACKILDQTKNGINKLIRNCTVPHYLKGNKVYFFEDELVKWVEKDRIQTFEEKYANRRSR